MTWRYCLAIAVCWIALPAWGQQEELAQIYEQAQRAQASGDLSTAAQKYEAIVRLRPDMAEGYANLGNIYYQLGKQDRAAAAYKKAIQIKPGLTGPYFFLGMMAFNSREYADALRYLKRAETLEPGNAMVRSYLGYTYYAQAAYGDATRELEQAAAGEATDQDVLYHLSKSYSHLAEQSLVALKRHFPSSPYTLLARGHIFEQSQDWKSAAEQYGAAREQLPGNTRLKSKAEAMSAKADGKEGVADQGPFDDVADGSLAYLYAPPASDKLNPEVEARQRRVREWTKKTVPTAEDLYMAGEGYQILSYLTSLEVIAIDARSPRAHQLQAQLYEASGKEDEAIGEYKEVLRLQPAMPNAHFSIGTLLWKNQRFTEARTELLRELEVTPHHPQALYELGDIALTGGERKEAEQYYLNALKYDPGMVEAHFALEKIYTELGQFDQSLEHLRVAIKLDDSDPTPHYRLAQIYRRMGKREESQKELAIFEQRRAKSSAKP